VLLVPGAVVAIDFVRDPSPEFVERVADRRQRPRVRVDIDAARVSDVTGSSRSAPTSRTCRRSDDYPRATRPRRRRPSRADRESSVDSGHGCPQVPESPLHRATTHRRAGGSVVNSVRNSRACGRQHPCATDDGSSRDRAPHTPKPRAKKRSRPPSRAVRTTGTAARGPVFQHRRSPTGRIGGPRTRADQVHADQSTPTKVDADHHADTVHADQVHADEATSAKATPAPATATKAADDLSRRDQGRGDQAAGDATKTPAKQPPNTTKRPAKATCSKSPCFSKATVSKARDRFPLRPVPRATPTGERPGKPRG